MPVSTLRTRLGLGAVLALAAAVTPAHEAGHLHERPNVVLARFLEERSGRPAGEDRQP